MGSGQAEWQLLKGGDTAKVTNVLGTAALSTIRGPQLIHGSMMAKFVFVFSLPLLAPITAPVFQLRNREHVP